MDAGTFSDWLDQVRGKHKGTLTLTLNNHRDDGKGVQLDAWDLPESLDAHELWKTMSELARLEADCLKGAQTYAVGVVSAGVLVARRLFQLEGGRADVPQGREGGGSLEVMQLLVKLVETREQSLARKDELVMRMTGAFTNGYVREIERLQTRNEHLELRDLARAEGYERLVSKQHERELAGKKTEHNMQMTQEVVHGLRMLAPLIGNKILGEKALSTDDTSLKDESLRAFMESIRPEQMEKLQSLLNPFQAVAVMEMWKTYCGPKDQQPATQEKR